MALEHWHTDSGFDEGCEGCQADILAGRVEIRARPIVVTLCGSTRFYSAFRAANYRETMAGRIVLSVGFYPHSAPEAHGEEIGITLAEKERLDRLHLQKIDMSDEILVLNQGGYIGDSTRREIAHAIRTGKVVRFLDPVRRDQREWLRRLDPAIAANPVYAGDIAPSNVGGGDG